jgi:hypothetical protein
LLLGREHGRTIPLTEIACVRDYRKIVKLTPIKAVGRPPRKP